jgi:hypothetical protein
MAALATRFFSKIIYEKIELFGEVLKNQNDF